MLRFFVISFFLVCISSCTGYKIIQSNYDKSIDFSKYKYFAWLPTNDSTNNVYDNPEFRDFFIKDFSKQLIKNKCALNKDTPDFLLSLKITYSSKKKFEKYLHSTQTKNPNIIQQRNYPNNTIKIPPKDYYYSENVSTLYNNETYITNQITYTEDCITINLYDNKTRKIIWTVTSEADIYEGDGVPANPNSIVKNMIKKLKEIKKAYTK